MGERKIKFKNNSYARSRRDAKQARKPERQPVAKSAKSPAKKVASASSTPRQLKNAREAASSKSPASSSVAEIKKTRLKISRWLAQTGLAKETKRLDVNHGDASVSEQKSAANSESASDQATVDDQHRADSPESQDESIAQEPGDLKSDDWTEADNSEKDRATSENQSDQSTSGSMTYDEYIQTITDQEAIIEISEDDDRWTKFVNNVSTAKQNSIKAYQFSKPHVVKFTSRMWNKVRLSFLPFLKTRNGMITSGAVVGVLFLFMVIGRLDTLTDDPATGNEPGGGQVSGAVDTNGPAPKFDIIETTNVKNGSDDVVFDPARGIASFKDTIDGLKITVSQQPLTGEELANATFLSDVANSLAAEKSFESSKGLVYLTIPSTDPEQDQSQTAILLHKGLLIFIRTQGTELDPTALLLYIDEMQ